MGLSTPKGKAATGECKHACPPRTKHTNKPAIPPAMPKGLGGHFSANSGPRINGVSVRKRPYGKRIAKEFLPSKLLGLD